MTFTVTEALLIALATGALSFFGSLVGFRAAVRVHLEYLRRDVDAAHDRLDAIKAPGAWTGRGARDGAGY